MSKKSFKKKFHKGHIELKSLLINSKRALKDFYNISKKLFLVIIITISLVSILPFLSAYVNARLIDVLVQVVAGEDIATGRILLLLGITLFIYLCLELFWKIFEYAERLAYQKCHVFYAYKVHESTFKLDLEIYESNKHNKFLNKIQDGYDWQPPAFIMLVFQALQEFLETMSAIFFMVMLSPLLIPLLILSLIPEFGINISASKSVYGVWNLKGDDRITFFNTAKYLHTSKYIKETKIFKSGTKLLEILRSSIKSFLDEQSKIVKKEAKNTVLARILSFSAKGFVHVWLVLKVIQDTLFSIGDYTFFVSTINRFTDSSRKLLRTLSRLYERNLFMKEYYKLVEMESKITVPEDPVILSTKEIPTIEFKNVTFSYPGSKEKVFDNFSIKIPAGEDVAFVGENGAGKTTFVKLLARLYDIQKGQILINGVDIKNIDLESWYNNIGILFQDFNKYAYSVEDNIGFGNIFKFGDKNNILKSSKDSGAHSFVKNYDLKYKKPLSKAYKKGIEPSEGQWQKIALARAFFRDANVLILDEPTSAIDAKAEYEIFQKIEKMQKKKTTIIISHRFSTVKKASKIYVVQKGRIMEQGNHNELMKVKNGIYKEMFTLQAKEYSN